MFFRKQGDVVDTIAVDAMKRNAAKAAIERLQQQKKDPLVLGVGTGSTVNFFIEYLAHIADSITACVASSEDTAKRLRLHKFEVIELNETSRVDLYIDSADEINTYCEMIKGGGGALTREKVIASMADEFWCIVDTTKVVKRLGGFPLPLEVIPMARSYIARIVVTMGGDPVYRHGFMTDNGHHILDVYNLNVDIPSDVESVFEHLPGLVTCGIFSNQTAADLIIVGGNDNGIRLIQRDG